MHCFANLRVVSASSKQLNESLDRFTHQDAKLQMGLSQEGWGGKGAGAAGDATKTNQCYTHNLSAGGETLPILFRPLMCSNWYFCRPAPTACAFSLEFLTD